MDDSESGLMFYRPFWWAKWAERPPKVKRRKAGTPFRHVHVEIRTQMVEICGQTRFQLGHGGSHVLSGI